MERAVLILILILLLLIVFSCIKVFRRPRPILWSVWEPFRIPGPPDCTLRSRLSSGWQKG